jgi:hypothetical protein
MHVNATRCVDAYIQRIIGSAPQSSAVFVDGIRKSVMISPLDAPAYLESRNFVIPFPDADMFVIGRKIQHRGYLPK